MGDRDLAPPWASTDAIQSERVRVPFLLPPQPPWTEQGLASLPLSVGKSPGFPLGFTSASEGKGCLPFTYYLSVIIEVQAPHMTCTDVAWVGGLVTTGWGKRSPLGSL